MKYWAFMALSVCSLVYFCGIKPGLEIHNKCKIESCGSMPSSSSCPEYQISYDEFLKIVENQ